MTSVLRRATADPELEATREAHAAGDFVQARRRLRSVVGNGGGATVKSVRGLAELEYLLGNYVEAEALLRRVVEEAGKNRSARVDAEVALALVYLQTNRYTAARGLFAGYEDAIDLPLWELMRSWGDRPPYRIDWRGASKVAVPFTRETDWLLPAVAIELDGLSVEARIDTGGDLLVLSPDVADALGVAPVVTTTGTFGGGAQGSLSYGKLGTMRLGGLTLEDVPVAIAGLDKPVLGTGLLRQFLATIDYPRNQLVLRPPTTAARAALRAELAADAVEVPFALALTHLIVARGSLDGVAPLTFILDSGLQDEEGAAFAAPPETLAAAGIPIPETIEDVRETGAGYVPLQVGRFPIRRLSLGPLVQHDLLGFYGVFPDAWKQPAEFPVHGIVSHGFLRRYSWTLDFQAMTLIFSDDIVPGSRRPAGAAAPPRSAAGLGDSSRQQRSSRTRL